nr:porin [Burkholderia multivorans]
MKTANSELIVWRIPPALSRTRSQKRDRKMYVSRDFAGYGATQIDVTAGIQQRF